MSYIQLKNVSRVYDDADTCVSALSGVDLTIKIGSYVSVVGSSGAGKSTLLHVIGGLDKATEGETIVDGVDVSKMYGKELFKFRNKKIGFVFQFYHLLHELTALENVMVPAVVGRSDFNVAIKRSRFLLDFLGLSERMNFYPHELSGGEQQRVALARALVNDPDILLCDEPTGNLDIDSTNMIRDFLRHLHEDRKKTIVLATHNLELANDAQSVLNIKNGKLEV